MITLLDSSINEGFHDRIEFAEGLFHESSDYEKSLATWQKLKDSLKVLLKEKGLTKEIRQLEELFQELVLGAAKYGYMTGYQDARYQHAEASYFQFIEQWNKNYIKPNK